jgi:hypothetical protein
MSTDANHSTRSSTNEMFEHRLYVANSTNLPSSEFYINHNQRIHQHQIDTDDNNRDAEDDDDDNDETIGERQWRQSSKDGTFGQWLYVANMRNLPPSKLHAKPTLQDKPAIREHQPILSTLFFLS